VEREQKAMIVISHPWEFVPKGSSHLNYHTNSIKNNTLTTSTATSNTNIEANKTEPSKACTKETEQQMTGTTSQINTRTMPVHMQSQRKNIKLELNNSSLTDYSFMCWQKTVPLINNLNFETKVTTSEL
jgi:hypothetical protein